VNAPIQDKAPQPPGLVPKHVQSWLIAGLALTMVLIMWLTGSKKPPSSTKPGTVPTTPPLLDVSEGKIAELQNRIEQLQREQLVAQNALAEQSRVLAGAGREAARSDHAVANPAGGERVEDPIALERKKRGYLSLFASNIALTYRKTSAVFGPNPATALARDAGISDSGTLPAETVSLIEPVKPAEASALLRQLTLPSSARPEPNPERKELVHPEAGPGARASASGKTYVLFEGTIFETVLVNRLDGAFTGPIECLLTTDTYSHDRQQLLIPEGSRVLGETRKVEGFGATRLAVIFHRLLMPDGYSVSLDQFKGLNQAGDTALRDKVNHHYAQIFGASLAVGVLGAVAEAGTGSALTQSGADRMREGFAASTAQSSAQILDRFLNILPTITIREGHRVKVYLSGDLTLPAYGNHKLPSDL
jgi:type IV secretion system protein TrbI